MAPTWRLHTKLYKFGWNTFPNNARKNYRTDLNLGEVVYISVIFHIPVSWLDFLNGYVFLLLKAWHCKPAIFSWIIETLVKIWENSEKLWKTGNSRCQTVHTCFYFTIWPQAGVFYERRVNEALSSSWLFAHKMRASSLILLVHALKDCRANLPKIKNNFQFQEQPTQELSISE